MIRVGTCSWKFPSWNGIVYDPDESRRYLAQYCRKYSTVEIDQWFWSLFAGSPPQLPRIETVAEYLADTPDDFTFSIKVPNSITLTHFYRKRRSEPIEPNPHFLDSALFTRFLERIHPLRDRTVSLMFQFEYLNKRKMTGLEQFVALLEGFLRSTAESAAQWPLAVEPRNPQFLEASYFELLARHRVAHVFTHGYYMPPTPKVYEQYGHMLRDRAVLRLLGGDRKEIEARTKKQWSSRVTPKEDELVSIADMIADLAVRGFDTTVNVNNHYEGSAPLTIGVLSNLLREREIPFR